MREPVEHGQRWVAYPALRPASRVYVVVNRVARDGSWADIRCFTWAVTWSKRQALVSPDRLPFASERYDWMQADLDAQEADWEAARRTVGGAVDGIS